jgi:hypothetical protein
VLEEGPALFLPPSSSSANRQIRGKKRELQEGGGRRERKGRKKRRRKRGRKEEGEEGGREGGGEGGEGGRSGVV